MHSRTRVYSAGILATTLTLGGLALGTTPAIADGVDVTTATTYWEWVEQDAGSIDDARSYFAIDGVDGTTYDAFDTVGVLEVTNAAESVVGMFTADTVTSTVVDGERAQFILTGTDPSGQNAIVLTLDIEGNFARWSYAVSGPDVSAITLRFMGNLGSDSATVSTASGTSAVSYQGGEGSQDPIVGYSASSNGSAGTWDFVGQDVSFETTGASAFSTTVLLGHFNPCGFDEALAFVTANQTQIDALFGTAYPEFGTCFTGAENTFAHGVAVDTFIPLAAAPQVYTGSEEDDTEFGLIDLWWILSAEGSDVNSTTTSVSNLPAGLNGELVWDAVNGLRLHLTGTPTEAGSVNSTLMISMQANGEGEGYRIELPGFVPLVVTAPAVVTPAAPLKPMLAESGVDAGGLVQASLLVLLFGGLLLAATRRLEVNR